MVCLEFSRVAHHFINTSQMITTLVKLSQLVRSSCVRWHPSSVSRESAYLSVSVSTLSIILLSEYRFLALISMSNTGRVSRISVGITLPL